MKGKIRKKEAIQLCNQLVSVKDVNVLRSRYGGLKDVLGGVGTGKMPLSYTSKPILQPLSNSTLSNHIFYPSHFFSEQTAYYKSQVVDQFGGKGNVLNFNVGDGVKFALPNVFWTRLTSKYGTVSEMKGIVC